MNRPLGIGIAGAARFAEFCIAAFEGLPEARVVAVMDTDRTRAETIAQRGAAGALVLSNSEGGRARTSAHLLGAHP